MTLSAIPGNSGCAFGALFVVVAGDAPAVAVAGGALAAGAAEGALAVVMVGAVLPADAAAMLPALAGDCALSVVGAG